MDDSDEEVWGVGWSWDTHVEGDEQVLSLVVETQDSVTMQLAPRSGRKRSLNFTSQ